jgi:hypothetical protein
VAREAGLDPNSFVQDSLSRWTAAAVAAKWDTRSQRGASGGGASCDAASELPERRLRGKWSIRPGRRRRLL